MKRIIINICLTVLVIFVTAGCGKKSQMVSGDVIGIEVSEDKIVFQVKNEQYPEGVFCDLVHDYGNLLQTASGPDSNIVILVSNIKSPHGRYAECHFLKLDLKNQDIVAGLERLNSKIELQSFMVFPFLGLKTLRGDSTEWIQTSAKADAYIY